MPPQLNESGEFNPKDSSSLGRWIEQQKPRIIRSNSRLSRQEAEDGFQDACLKVVEDLDRFSDIAHENRSAYFCRIAYRQVLDRLSKNSARRKHEEFKAQIDTSRPSLNPTLPADLRDEFLTHLGNLPETQQSLISAIVLEGRSYGDLAEELGISERNVFDRFNRARAKLKEMIRNDMDLFRKPRKLPGA